jgi:DNA-binding CsgD family transcriptional regulator
MQLCAEERQVTDELAQRVAAVSGGNPLIAREFVDAMRLSGEAFREVEDTGIGCGNPAAWWRLRSGVSTPIPDSVVRFMTRRTDRLGPYSSTLMSAAAVVGGCFPAALLSEVSRVGEAELRDWLRDAVHAGLVEPCRKAPGWYELCHPALRPAFLTQTSDRERGLWARRAAAAAAGTGSGLGHVGLVARLLGTVLQELSRSSASEALGRAQAQRATAETLTVLIPALADAGEPDEALRLADWTRWIASELPAELAAAVALRAAWVAVLVGRREEAQVWIKQLHGLGGSDHDGSFVLERDLVAAWAALDSPLGHESERAAERLMAEIQQLEAKWPDRRRVETRAVLLLGQAARRRDARAAARWFAHAATLAHQDGPAVDRIRSLISAGEQDWLIGAPSDRLERAGDEARRVGALALARAARSSMLLRDTLWEREVGGGNEQTDGVGTEVTAIGAGLRGDRATLERMLNRDSVDCDIADRDRSDSFPLDRGIGAAFCALLEEKPGLALHETHFATAERRDPRECCPLVEPAGLDLLLRVLYEGAGRREYDEALAQSVRGVCWNDQFTHLADAVLLGRAGRRRQAAAAVAHAELVAESFPTAHHLGLRLVADAAIADGWGEPALWLRRAEDHFHALRAPAVADACRARLRRLGVRIPQHRRDAERVPAALRARGVTVREYEVLRLLAGGAGNRQIAGALQISPRTVEKHVASLLMKSGHGDRAALARFADV